MRNIRNPSLTVPDQKLVSELELEVMSSCLVRQGREIKEGIRSLQANMRDSESRIKGMYKEMSMQQQGYCLHTMMVHKGYYWAYQHYMSHLAILYSLTMFVPYVLYCTH